MDFDFTELYNSLPHYIQIIASIFGFIFVVFVVGLLNSSFVKDSITSFFDKKWKLFKKKKDKKKDKNIEDINIIDIDNHNLFNYMDFWIYNQIPSMTFKTQYRTVVFRKYLHFFFQSHKDKISGFINEGNYRLISNQELKNLLLGLVTEITIDMENEMRKAGIPEVVIIKMKNELGDKLNLTRDLIESISDSSFYDSDDNLLKVYSFLNIIHSILDNTISSIEHVCNEINGELSGLSMDGFTEPSSNGDH